MSYHYVNEIKNQNHTHTHISSAAFVKKLVINFGLYILA